MTAPTSDNVCEKPIDDDHFTYEGGMRQCISGFGRNYAASLLELIDRDKAEAEGVENIDEHVAWPFDELVRWCRNFNGETQRLERQLAERDAEVERLRKMAACPQGIPLEDHLRNLVGMPRSAAPDVERPAMLRAKLTYDAFGWWCARAEEGWRSTWMKVGDSHSAGSHHFAEVDRANSDASALELYDREVGDESSTS